ncbi:hypothetical protein HDU98_001569 [Podochytrium sp. JEL0797]|nr:hypothetical protein HDU98_001569 [Podochytrium sp. JEL0797]
MFIELLHRDKDGSKGLLSGLTLSDESAISVCVGAVMDNTSANKKAWRILERENTQCFFSGCISHGLNLLAQDLISPKKTRSNFRAAETDEDDPDDPDADIAFPVGYCFDELAKTFKNVVYVIKCFRNNVFLNDELKNMQHLASVPALESPGTTRLRVSAKTALSFLPLLSILVSKPDFVNGVPAKAPICAEIVKFQLDSAPVSDCYKELVKARHEMLYILISYNFPLAETSSTPSTRPGDAVRFIALAAESASGSGRSGGSLRSSRRSCADKDHEVRVQPFADDPDNQLDVKLTGSLVTVLKHQIPTEFEFPNNEYAILSSDTNQPTKHLNLKPTPNAKLRNKKKHPKPTR